MNKQRLDEFLVANGDYTTRARARDAILRGCIAVDGLTVAKPSKAVTGNNHIRIDDPAKAYVSRAALKLTHALDETGYSPDGKLALDLGASTGGFCQVLLEAGARKVYAIDVGHGQIDPLLLENERLINLEGVNARNLTAENLDSEIPEFITCDVSFISLKKALPAALALAAPGAVGIFLVKPQFEVGKGALGSGGIVKEPALSREAAIGIRDWLNTNEGWKWTHFMESPILGGDGNREFLLAGVKHD